MKKRTWARASLATVALAVAGSGLFALTATGASSEAPTLAVDATATASAADMQQYQSLIDKLYGTPRQRLLASKLIWHNLNKGMSDCMAQNGFGYTGSDFDGVEVQAAPGDFDLIAPLGGAPHSLMAERLAQTRPSKTLPGAGLLAAKTAGREAAYNEAITHCWNGEKDKPYFGDASPQERATAAGNKAQAERFGTLINTFEASVKALEGTSEANAKLDGYQQCLATRGFPAASWADLQKKVSRQFAGFEIKWAEVQSSGALAAAVAFERNAATADTECRGGVRSWAIANLDLADLHANPTTAELAAGWAAIEADATAAGLN